MGGSGQNWERLVESFSWWTRLCEGRARIGYSTYGWVLAAADGGMEETRSEANRKLPYNFKGHY